MNENERNEIIEQGRQAKTILDTPLFNQVIDEMRAACMHELESNTTGDPDKIMPVWRQLKSINKFKENITAKLSNASVERHNEQWDKDNA